MNINMDGEMLRREKKHNLTCALPVGEYVDFADFCRVNGVVRNKVIRTAIREFLMSRGYTRSTPATVVKDEFMKLYEEEVANATH